MWSNTDLTQKTESVGHVLDTDAHTNMHVHIVKHITHTHNTYFCSLFRFFLTHLFNLGLLDLLQGHSDIVCLQLGSLLLLHARTHTHRERDDTPISQCKPIALTDTFPAKLALPQSALRTHVLSKIHSFPLTYLIPPTQIHCLSSVNFPLKQNNQHFCVCFASNKTTKFGIEKKSSEKFLLAECGQSFSVFPVLSAGCAPFVLTHYSRTPRILPDGFLSCE